MNFRKLTAENKQFYLAKIEDSIISKMLFLKTDFTLSALAKETGIQLHSLSYLINSEINCHFKDYLNLKRIEYFKENVNNYEWNDLTVERMAMASGFRSRTTCYRAFLKHVGMSPLEYLKSHRIEFESRKVSKASSYNYG